jgi:hypothetical protein
VSTGDERVNQPCKINQSVTLGDENPHTRTHTQLTRRNRFVSVRGSFLVNSALLRGYAIMVNMVVVIVLIMIMSR